MDFMKLVEQLLALGGFAAIVAIVVNVLKAVGVVKDGTGGTWAAGFNLVGLIALYGLQIFAPELGTGAVDVHLAQVAEILSLIFSYVIQNWVSQGTHKVLSKGNVPLIGTSFTAKEPF